jgi:hypothetical protein
MKIICLLPLVLCGCLLSVPETRIKVDPANKSVNIQSPKDVRIEDFKADFHPTATGVVVNISFKKYESKSNVEVIRAVAEHNAKVGERGAVLLGEVLDAAK